MALLITGTIRLPPGNLAAARQQTRQAE